MANITVKHRFVAPAERVFDAWLDPAQASRFLFATATGTIVRCDIDARVGGHFAIVDRRHDADVVHEGTFIELDRPSRIVFTLRVPSYSTAEDLVSIDIESRSTGCELRLTARADHEAADAAKRGWTAILDVLDQMLSQVIGTCGAGLAQQAVIARRIAAYLDQIGETLELHRELLVEGERESITEDLVYRELTARHRHLANRLRDVADYLAQQLELPMGRHDNSRWSDRHQKAFARLLQEQDALTSVLRAAAQRGERLLASMQQQQHTPA